MDILEIQFATDLYREMLLLRDEMLRKPIGLKHSEADLDKEPGYRHFCIILKDRMVACLMVVPHPDDWVQIRQMAVLDSMQGQGYGRILMTHVEELFSKERRVRRIFLNARSTAIGFYEKLGYRGVGEIFMEVGIPHLRMEKSL